MNSEHNSRKAAEVLGNPAILQGAWMRVDSWYQKGDLAPQPELSRWRLYPEAMLRELAEDFRAANWSPDQWRQVPYPKKGARLRHYVMPTVRDQVAFMAHMVALGPILDAQIANFAFGNRWYRPIAWDRRAKPPRWRHRRYPVLTERTFLSYARSHGLFRRVAHWTVARMTDATLPATDDSGRVQLPVDYEESELPPWTRKDWWSGTLDTPRAFWAALDLELAYPSVRLSRLAVAMEQALRRPVNVHSLFDGCPQTVLEALALPDVRANIGYRLSTALSQITLDPGEIPLQSWGPPPGHLLPQVSADDGIPTGLAISGMLLNVVFLEPDRIIQNYLERNSGERRGAIVRFADDMYVMSRSQDGLWSLVEIVHGALSGAGAVPLARPNRGSNICINFKKIRPDAVQEVIRSYLLDNGWRQCADETCRQPLPPHPSGHAPESILNWVAKLSNGELARYRESLLRTAIARGGVGPFVTGLVERLSDMGTDTLRQRFGDGARDHLARLHELARFDISDEQVRPDTRRTFSVNRLVRAWLPKAREVGEEHRELRRIRDTVGFVLDRTPWKFTIWRAVVRAAARRGLSEPKPNWEEASEWLANQLRRIACVTDSTDSAAWLNAWPEVDADDGHANERAERWSELYLSFLRAAFWRALAQAIRELRRHAARMADEERDAWVPAPALWATRAVADGEHAQVAASLDRIERWVDVLYPAQDGTDMTAWPWELDEFVGAILATHSTKDLADAWRRAAGPGAILVVPETARLEGMPKARSILARSGRLRQTGLRRNRRLDYWALANVQLGHWDQRLGGVLFPMSGRPRIARAEGDARSAVAAGFALGCCEWVGPAVGRRALPSMGRNADQTLDLDGFVLRDYACARRLIVGHDARPAGVVTVHRLLWGAPAESPLNDWLMAPWETPAVGLPSRVAAALLRVVRTVDVPGGWVPSEGPLNWLIDDMGGVLAAGRRGQFGPERETAHTEPALQMERSTAWEVLPHAAYYLPFASASGRELHGDSYVLYCDVLLLLTALDGDERILEGLARTGVRGTPFVDRWSWRARIHLPRDAWKSIEEALRWSAAPESDVTKWGERLVESLAGWSRDAISTNDFRPERIDVGLPVNSDWEIVRTIGAAGDVRGPELPLELRVGGGGIASELVVRVGQVAAWPSERDVVGQFPRVSTTTANEMIEEVCNAFLAPAQGAGDSDPGVVVLPELAVPQQEVGSLRELVRSEGKAAVAGLYWRAVRPAFCPPRGFSATRRFFVNEAELIVPVGEDRGPPAVRWFRVRKPVAAHMEDGLAVALSTGSAQTSWRMLRGRRWYRFVHPRWGDFSVAICADLIDAAPWRALRGELLHLLMVAFNKDVELFESLTWVRAYENYVNVASVNHGRYGGSFLWTPRRTHGRELAGLRGRGLVLTADVRLPVRELLEVQREGVDRAIDQAAGYWRGESLAATPFKAPPPGFRRDE